MDKETARREPRAFEGDERTETLEQTQTIARTIEDRAQELIARLEALGRERERSRDQSRGMG
jgi:hypothetical protein